MVRLHPGHPDPPAADAGAPGLPGHRDRLISAITPSAAPDPAGPGPAGPGLAARTLVLGGTRSGKSAWAEALLADAGPVLYVATARGVDPGADAEWAARVAGHRARRPAAWATLEDPDLPAVVAERTDVPVLVDDLATWMTGLLDDAGWARDAPGVAAARAGLLEAVAARSGAAPLVVVSAEVGLGVVPSTPAGRRFRDELGLLNTALAAVCDDVRLLVAGRALRLE